MSLKNPDDYNMLQAEIPPTNRVLKWLWNHKIYVKNIVIVIDIRFAIN